MRPYQLDGMEWLQVLYENGINGILGDEMGLGKTLQCVGLIGHLIEMNVKGPFLVVAPLSTVTNWVTEFRRFSPSVSTKETEANIIFQLHSQGLIEPTVASK